MVKMSDKIFRLAANFNNNNNGGVESAVSSNAGNVNERRTRQSAAASNTRRVTTRPQLNATPNAISESSRVSPTASSVGKTGESDPRPTLKSNNSDSSCSLNSAENLDRKLPARYRTEEDTVSNAAASALVVRADDTQQAEGVAEAAAATLETASVPVKKIPSPRRQINSLRRNPIKSILSVNQYRKQRTKLLSDPRLLISSGGRADKLAKLNFSVNESVVRLKLVDAFKTDSAPFKALYNELIPQGLADIQDALRLVSDLKENMIPQFDSLSNCERKTLLRPLKRNIEKLLKHAGSDLKQVLENALGCLLIGLEHNDRNYIEGNNVNYAEYKLKECLENSGAITPGREVTEKILALADGAIDKSVDKAKKITKIYSEARDAVRSDEAYDEEILSTLIALNDLDPQFADVTEDKELSEVAREYAASLLEEKGEVLYDSNQVSNRRLIRPGVIAHNQYTADGTLVSSPTLRVQARHGNRFTAPRENLSNHPEETGDFKATKIGWIIDADTPRNGHFWNMLANDPKIGCGSATAEVRVPGKAGTESRTIWVLLAASLNANNN